MSAKHLRKGSVLPPFSGKLRVYSMRFCPFAQRVITVLNAKKLDFEVVNISLMEKPEWLTSKSPLDQRVICFSNTLFACLSESSVRKSVFVHLGSVEPEFRLSGRSVGLGTEAVRVSFLGKVPSLEIEENVVIHESLIIAEYLENKYPLPKLVSSDPLRRAQDKLIVENFSAMPSLFHKALMVREEVNEGVISQFYGHLEAVQGELSKRGTKFLGGATPGIVDYMIWPWFERFGVLPKLGETRFNIDDKKFSVLQAWIEAMKKDLAVVPHFLDEDDHIKYIQSKIDGIFDFDVLLK